jgi:hypothetical protein
MATEKVTMLIAKSKNDSWFRRCIHWLRWQDQQSDESDWGFNRVTGWKLKRCWHPQTCFLTGKQLWSKQAYYGERPRLSDTESEGEPYWIDRDEVMIEPYWVDSDEFIMWQLKK